MNYSELLQLTKGWSNFVSDCINIWRLQFDNKYIIFSSVFLFYKNDRDFTPCRHVAYAYIISSFTISLAHALTLFILFEIPTFEKSKLSSVNPLFKAFSDKKVWILFWLSFVKNGNKLVGTELNNVSAK